MIVSVSHFWIIPSPYSEGIKHYTISNLFFLDCPGRTNTRAHAIGKTVPLYEWNERGNTRISRRIFRSNVNKAKQDLPVRQKTKASEGSNSTVKREKVVSKIVGLKKKARKHRSDSKLNGREVPADISVKQPNKVLAGCRITRS